MSVLLTVVCCPLVSRVEYVLRALLTLEKMGQTDANEPEMPNSKTEIYMAKHGT